MKKYPNIIKNDGSMEEFDPQKLRDSLMRSGAYREDADEVLEHILGEIKESATTEFIYRHAFNILKHMRAGLAAKYSLRRALAELGPTGFPFERFVAKVQEANGWKTDVGLMIEGKCLSYEIDVVARDEANKKLIVTEAKFHNQSTIKSDLKVALYVKARFDDLVGSNIGGRLSDGYTPEAWIVTNTKFTGNAKAYAECVGLKLVGWDYPSTKSLKNMIENAQLEPITTLTTLSEDEKRHIIIEGSVLCRDITDNPKILDSMGIDKERQKSILDEVHGVCTIQ